jgi:phage shock protein E
MILTLPELMAQVAPNVRCLEIATAKTELGLKHGTLIDVREPAEHAAASVAGSVNIPRGVLEMKLPELYPDPATPIYLHCASGGRARLSAEQLKRIGYTNVTAIISDFNSLSNSMAGLKSPESN